MFLIDFEAKGNLIKLYFGIEKDYYGDDWDDYPYEHNAALVYDRFIKKSVTFGFPFKYSVLLAENDWRYEGNSPYCKNDFKDQKAPCMIITKNIESCEDCYSEYMGARQSNIYKLYFNAEYYAVLKSITDFGGVKIEEEDYNNLSI